MPSPRQPTEPPIPRPGRHPAATGIFGLAAPTQVDTDGDGLETWQEHRLGSHPLDPTSRSEIALSAAGPPDGARSVLLTFRQPPDPRATVSIEPTNGAAAWAPVGDVAPITITDGFARAELPVAPGEVRRLLRVRYDFTDAVAP